MWDIWRQFGSVCVCVFQNETLWDHVSFELLTGRQHCSFKKRKSLALNTAAIATAKEGSVAIQWVSIDVESMVFTCTYKSWPFWLNYENIFQVSITFSISQELFSGFFCILLFPLVCGSSQVAHGLCEVPSMKVLTRGMMKEHWWGSIHDLSQLLAFYTLLRWPQTPCHKAHACHCACHVIFVLYFFSEKSQPVMNPMVVPLNVGQTGFLEALVVLFLVWTGAALNLISFQIIHKFNVRVTCFVWCCWIRSYQNTTFSVIYNYIVQSYLACQAFWTNIVICKWLADVKQASEYCCYRPYGLLILLFILSNINSFKVFQREVSWNQLSIIPVFDPTRYPCCWMSCWSMIEKTCRGKELDGHMVAVVFVADLYMFTGYWF